MISELRKYKQMNPIMLTSLYPAALLLGYKTNLEGVQKMLKDKELLKKLLSFDSTSVTQATHKLLDKYIHSKEFDMQKISRISVGCCYLAEWVVELHDMHAQQLVQ